MTISPDEVSARVGAIPYWYHTMELAPGVVTPGHFDLRDVVAHLPWPDLRGLRCLDVATFDGFYAFEMERRGAAEVVAIDIDDAADLDWLPRQVPPGFERGDEPIGLGFKLAHELRSSRVKRVVSSVYDLTPEELGTFDFVMCGALMQHLRDPFLALQRIRSVCGGQFLSVELVDPWSSLFSRRPVQAMSLKQRTWTIANVRGHREMLIGTGFDITQATVMGMPFGPGFTQYPKTPRQRLRRTVLRLAWRLVGGTADPPFSVVLCRPAPDLERMPS